ncbi:Bax inhibitor-1/YccA family protein [Amylibacter sp. IMCC11727]|uniref:Bax inhibitor-1/YccA family protein n=1 Tax=Amylibacter sp. IMCC11727 TaxID=3039851 RepID=UPI00244DF955|nr:Bax inhibitor-1/YccA family protein [Amylibacter sp. IMCC11727]WGI23030.1 Bax inhibitor-1/YccA family protein [Amylibacter sp. IMCC11727]
MAQYETVRRANAGVGVDATQIDAGLRAHMNKVYGLMSVAMFITGIVAYFVGTDFARAINGEETAIFSTGMLQAMYSSPIRWIIMFAPLAFVFGLSAMINRMSMGTAQIVFWAFAAVMGLSISWIFAVFAEITIAQIFFATTIMFASISLWGYTTKKDLSGWGSFLFMGLIGIIGVSILNIWMQSDGLAFAVNIIGVLVFAGLTAYDTQNIKNTYLVHAHHGDTEWLGKSAIMGALSLYLNFINMFMMLLQLFGNQE